MDNTYDVELDAVEDGGVLGTGRRHFVLPTKPKSPEVARALEPAITGGIWILRDGPIPDRIIINLK